MRGLCDCDQCSGRFDPEEDPWLTEPPDENLLDAFQDAAKRMPMDGLNKWSPEDQEPFFGLERSIPVKLAPSPDSRVEGLRRWLGYKLYAVVYWLLRGHA